MDLKGLTERRTEKSKQIRKDSRKKGKDWSPRRGKEVVVREDDMIGAITANPTIENFVASGQTTMTNTPVKSTERGLEMGNSMKETSEQLTLLPYQNTTSCVRDFLARVSVLLESEEDLKILEAHSSLRYAGSYGLKDLAIYSLRMLKDSSPMMTEALLKELSERWMSWGMTVNGRCLTARITVFHKTGKGCSLSDILEKNPDQKYFLSEKLIKAMVAHKEKHQEAGDGFGMNIIDGKQARSLRVGGSGVSENLITSTISERYYKDGSEILIQETEGDS